MFVGLLICLFAVFFLVPITAHRLLSRAFQSVKNSWDVIYDGRGVMGHNLTAGGSRKVKMRNPGRTSQRRERPKKIFSVMHAQNQSTENVFVTFCLFHRFSFLRGKTGIEIHQ